MQSNCFSLDWAPSSAQLVFDILPDIYYWATETRCMYNAPYLNTKMTTNIISRFACNLLQQFSFCCVWVIFLTHWEGIWEQVFGLIIFVQIVTDDKNIIISKCSSIPYTIYTHFGYTRVEGIIWEDIFQSYSDTTLLVMESGRW